jgi:beta-dihydromenaquinone-9 omega-hydroxylase
MTMARRLRFRAHLMKVGVDGAVSVARDKATSYGYSLTGRKTAPATDFDPFSSQVMHDPYPGYQSLLTGTEVPNVWYNRKRGIWIIAGYDDVRKALRDNEELSSAQSQSRFRVHLPSMNAADPPEHTRLRKFVSRAFTARAMTAWQTNINEVADGLVDAVIARRTFEAVSELAKPLPTRLIARMLGIPRDDQPQFVEWSDEMVAGAFAPLTPRGMRLSARSGSATAAMRRSLDPLIAQRRRSPGDDLISMMTPADADDVLTDDEIFWSAAMLIGAGSETTTNLLSGLLLTLAQQPDLYARLREHPELVPAAIEEQLRLVAPVQGFYRTATRDYTVGENTIPAGAKVLLLFAAANRDPRHYEDPDTFDLDRNPTDHLAFGGGVHYCLGVPLTRLEGARVFSQLLPRVEEIRLAGDYRYLDNPTMRGLEHLPLELIPAKGA